MNYLKRFAALACMGLLFSTPVQAERVKCLATAIYFEARGEPDKCQMKVADVIINRVDHQKFANSVCGVVYQKGQFSWVGKNYRITDKDRYNKAVKIATQKLNNRHSDTTNGATFFSTGYHFKGTRKVDECANHKFFKV